MFKFSSGQTPVRIGFFLGPKFSVVPFVNALDPMRMANRLSDRTIFEWTIISDDGHPVEAINGMSIVADAAVEDAGFFPNAICCIGFEPIMTISDRVKHWLRKLERQGARLGALSAGSLVLAEAGLLDGYRATIHWNYIESFRERFPKVDVTRTLFEIDRDRFTCAGGAAAMDMLLHFIDTRLDRKLADEAADMFLVSYIRESSDDQRASNTFGYGAANPLVVKVVSLMEQSIETPLTIPQLAKQAEVSQRKMEIVFRSQLGTPPARFYRRLRLQNARRLLIQTSMLLAEIAFASGFQSLEVFSRAYKSEFGTAPSLERSHRQNPKTARRAPPSRPRREL